VCDVKVKEENLFDVAIYREVLIENFFWQEKEMNRKDMTWL